MLPGPCRRDASQLNLYAGRAVAISGRGPTGLVGRDGLEIRSDIMDNSCKHQRIWSLSQTEGRMREVVSESLPAVFPYDRLDIHFDEIRMKRGSTKSREISGR